MPGLWADQVKPEGEFVLHRGMRFLQNSMYKTSFHRQKIRVTELIILGSLGFFSKSSLKRWAFGQKSCVMNSQRHFVYALHALN